MSQTQLIHQMQQTEFYHHSVQTPIELLQTHASSVLLTGAYAYKLKKIVNFGFLDFSTLGKRNHFLNQELTMNQVIAPEIYLEVLPITQEGEKYILNGTGEPVEYVLKMRQFPQENLLINLFNQGKLTENHLVQLGKIIADFHNQTITNEYIKNFGTIENINHSIQDNYRHTEKYVGIIQDPDKFNQIKQFTDHFLIQKQTTFQQRQQQNKIRECHGDLHLRNLCLWEDKILLFDRIEFNEEFRFVDVMYDIAFAVMDLEARGRKDLGNILLNTYIEETGDWEGLEILPLYLSRQAYVRAKVTSFLLDDPAISETAKQEAAKTAKDYYNLAWQYTQKQQGKLTIMSGLSGSGKTTIARQIAQQNNAIHIRSDAVRKHLAGIPLNQKGESNIYDQEMTQKTYQRLLKLGELLTNEGFNVILDAKYDRLKFRQEVVNLSQEKSLPLEIIYCDAPLDILTQRLTQRSGDISDATSDLLAQQQTSFEAFTENEQKYLKIIQQS
jgi:aminoglycoside phosphotransferase family enzyme/predicted kinase